MLGNNDCCIYLSLCMHCGKIYRCNYEGANGRIERQCDSCEQKSACVWRRRDALRNSAQNCAISHGYCSYACLFMDGENVDDFSIDEIVTFLSQSDFPGNLTRLRRQMEALIRAARQRVMSQKKIIETKKMIISRILA